ncbi:MAG: TIM44-like domain-containing protein [bacterium]
MGVFINRIKHLIKKYNFIFILITAEILVFISEYVWARAGGGDSFGGGGGNYGSGGGSGGGDILGLLIYLAFRNPVIGVPLLVMFVIFSWKGGSKVKDVHVSNTIKRGRQRQTETMINLSYKKIKNHDPSFDPDKFLKRVRIAFFKIQEAWIQKNMENVQAFVSDGVVERYNIQFEIQNKWKIANIMKNMAVNKCEIVSVQSDSYFETINIKIYASAVDYWISTETKRIVRGSNISNVTFVEYWTFLRRPGAKTSEKPGLIEGSCPNCGAYLKMSDTVKCDSCNSLISSGEYDWILSKITQESQWRVREGISEIPGVWEFQQLDPAFNIQFVEDRTSVIFWRYHKALIAGKTDFLKKVAVADFCDSVDSFIKKENYYYDEIAIGVSEVSRVCQGDLLDTVDVLINWSGYKVVNIDGKPQKNTSKNFYSHVFTLSRKRNAKTNAESGLQSSHCPGCGAPVTSNMQSVCEYCGLEVANQNKEWMLSSIITRTEWNDMRLKEKAKSRCEEIKLPEVVDPVALLYGIYSVMMADGKIDDKEMKYIRSYMAKRKLPKQNLDEITASYKAGTIDMPNPSSFKEGRVWLDEMIEMSFAEGDISKDERHFLESFGKSISLSKTDVNLQINRKRTEIYCRMKELAKYRAG